MMMKFLASRLHIDDTGNENAGIADDHASRLETSSVQPRLCVTRLTIAAWRTAMAALPVG